MEPNLNPTPQKPDTLSTLSLVAGIFALVSCCFPPLQLFLGASAIMLAILSKKGAPFSKRALTGLIIGIISAVCSVLIFLNFLLTVTFMKDPANAALINQIMEQYQTLFDSMQAP